MAEKILKEKLLLRECKKGDSLYVDVCNTKGGWNHLGHITLVKIKYLNKGKVQIKYRSNYRGSTIQKIELDANASVERTRPVTEADGPDVGWDPDTQYRRARDGAIIPLLPEVEAYAPPKPNEVTPISAGAVLVESLLRKTSLSLFTTDVIEEFLNEFSLDSANTMSDVIVMDSFAEKLDDQHNQ